ncbi:MAG TPA: hypothetical protein VG319_06715 [Polyangia bacterium]|jgi:hypothetical protein|nr:hypothetical protein [Polyangia bacterium]
MRRSLIAAGLAGLCALASARPARATTCAAPPGADASLAAMDGGDRLSWIDRKLGEDAARGRLWTYGWVIGIGAAGVASLAAVPFVAAKDRVDWYVSAATAAVGVVPLLAVPLEVKRDAPKLRAALAAGPLDDDARVCALLADAEGKLAADAADERRQRGWWMHAGNVAFNTGVLLFLGLGYHHWSSGLINGVAGAAVGEALLFTQPTGTIDAAASYRRGDLSGEEKARAALSWGWTYALGF